VVEGSAWVTGANQPGKHAAYVVAGRDFEADGTIEAAEVRAGDACPRCGHPLSIDRGIEIGHIFQLGRKYADAAGLDALGPDGKPIRITMGSYGVGVSRAVAVLAEQRHDELGLVWPREVAPADVHIVGTGKENQIEVAAQLAETLESRGLRVLVDDRAGVSPGVKFKDSELLGLPTVLIVGRGLAQGVVELRDRAAGTKEEIPLAEAVDRVLAAAQA
jgi:prolyl-tRNA synthetase